MKNNFATPLKGYFARRGKIQNYVVIKSMYDNDEYLLLYIN